MPARARAISHARVTLGRFWHSSCNGGPHLEVPHAAVQKIHARIQSLDERLARLRMKKGRLLARAGQSERKRDTRRKILIGGAVLAAVDHEGVPALRTATRPPAVARREAPTVHTIARPSTCANRGGPQNPFGPIGQPARSGAAVKEADQGRHREAARSVLDGRASEGHKKSGPKLDAHRAVSSDARQKHDSESDDETT